MSGVNKVILFGHIKGKPLFEAGQNNRCKLSFELTTIEKYRNDLQHAETHHIIMYNYVGFSAHTVLLDGMLVYLEGSVNTINFVDELNVKRHETRIQCSTFKILSHAQIPAA
ncbi:hypothetical protein A0256_03390 [Mucilaginibacter sp. PAMC 26640]|nr:hypothetical protein A0256_03390 [Mucilaginibacter sp. PAMC 26640]